ncbi:GumC family protein [Pseudanabaena sp. PCC 6802]|uniref:GumC family protein n=1 Tax=Pseudanabaena sp. PCC 6802 TaxID=118173 RepID=UPI00034C6166|nr:polysaccharide biosynthesis tyrosine autokinase [Pseudanabaena sp. PCC 6802]
MNLLELNVPQKIRQQEDSNPLIGLLTTLRRQWLPATIVFVGVFGISAYLASRQKPLYEASGELIFKVDRAARLTGIGDEEKKQTNLQTEARVILSAPVVELAVKSLDPAFKDIDITDGLSVIPSPDTNILKVSYQSENPKEPAEVVNALMKSYIANDLQANQAESVTARKFILSQLPNVEKDLVDSELALRRFKEKNRVTALAQESSSSIGVVIGTDKQITDLKAQISNLEASIRAMRSRLGISTNQATLLSTLSASEPVKQTFAELQKVEQQLAVQSTQYSDGHPIIKRLKRQQTTLQTLLQQRVAEVIGGGKSINSKDLQVGGLDLALMSDLVKSEINRSGLQQQLDTLERSLNTYSDRLRVIPKLEQEQQSLERKIAVNRITYESLLKRLQEVQLVENQKVSNARVLSSAVEPTQPIASKLKSNLMMSGLLGLAVAIATAIALQSMDTLLRTTDDLERAFDSYPLLGVLPKFGRKWVGRQDAIVCAEPGSQISETYRMLQTKLEFLNANCPLKVILITSSVPSEGKSTVSANLAAIAAQLGKHVLLIDTDMRHPSQHAIWDIPHGLGLTDLLAGQTPEGSVIHTVIPNLNLLLAGKLPSNTLSLSLLKSQRMSALMEKWADIYDYVILDTPPLLPVADAMVLSKQADGVLIVARPELLSSPDASVAKKLLDKSDINVLGLVANGATPRVYYKYRHYAPTESSKKLKRLKPS